MRLGRCTQNRPSHGAAGVPLLLSSALPKTPRVPQAFKPGGLTPVSTRSARFWPPPLKGWGTLQDTAQEQWHQGTQVVGRTEGELREN